MIEFDKAWDIVKNDDVSWNHIWEAGLTKEKEGDESFLVRLIQLLDDTGRTYSAERKAVDLMLNSEWPVEDTKARIYRTSQGTRPDTAMVNPYGDPNKHVFLNELPTPEVMMDEEEDKPGVLGQRWRTSSRGTEYDMYE